MNEDALQRALADIRAVDAARERGELDQGLAREQVHHLTDLDVRNRHLARIADATELAALVAVLQADRLTYDMAQRAQIRVERLSEKLTGEKP